MKRGIDISYHQGSIDFSKVKESGIEFIILREGYGSTIDPRFYEYVRRAKENDIIILGVYHFSYATTKQDAEIEATFCVQNMINAGIGMETLVFYDFEYDTVIKAAKKGVILNTVDCNEFTVSFCEKVQTLGYTAGVYANIDYCKNWYSPAILGKYPLWYAEYTTKKPDVKCMIHQHSDEGNISGIKGNVDLDIYYGDFKMSKNRSRSAVVQLARSWLGKNEKDGSHKSIIDIYNSYKARLPRGVKMKYDWSWCACTWSALAISLGYTDIMPIEISCGYLIEEAKKMDIWVENDGYVPKPGDAILYKWDDPIPSNDNKEWPDHIGVIEYVNDESGYMIVIEGNYDDAVKKRTISINGKYIRGFITPRYDDNDAPFHAATSSDDIQTIAKEVIAGVWGSGNERKKRLEEAGFDYKNIQDEVNKILNNPDCLEKDDIIIRTTCYANLRDNNLAAIYETTANLYCRNDAGTNKKALCLLPKGTTVKCYGYYTLMNNVKWLLIETKLNNIKYVGFCSGQYLKKV